MLFSLIKIIIIIYSLNKQFYGLNNLLKYYFKELGYYL